MFENLTEAMEWAREQFPGCSFSVKEQEDGPTIVSIKGKDNRLRTVIYIRQKREAGGETNG